MVDDSDVEQRLLAALRRADLLNLLWFGLCVVTLSLAIPYPAFIPAVAIAFFLVTVGVWVSEYLAVGSTRRRLRTVVDERSLFARFRSARFETSRAALESTLGYAAAALFLMYAAGFFTGASILVFALGIIVIGLIMLIVWATESE